MKKEKKQPKKDKEKKSSGKAFLKKRAPIYLAVITLVVVFVIPELMASTLEDFIPENLTGKEKEALDIFLSYRGPNNSGLNSIDVISEKIRDDYPDEKIFDKKDTIVKFLVKPIDNNSEQYSVILDFQTKKENTSYEWSVKIDTGKVNSVNLDAKKILEIVDYSK